MPEVYVELSVIFTGRLGSEIFWIKGQVLHRGEAHLKVPAGLSGLRALPNRITIGQTDSKKTISLPC